MRTARNDNIALDRASQVQVYADDARCARAAQTAGCVIIHLQRFTCYITIRLRSVCFHSYMQNLLMVSLLWTEFPYRCFPGKYSMESVTDNLVLILFYSFVFFVCHILFLYKKSSIVSLPIHNVSPL
jgi:hypothetical protein